MNSKSSIRLSHIFLFMLACLLFSCNLFGEKTIEKPEYKIIIPIYGNSWLINEPMRSDEMITETGIRGWSQESDRLRTNFRVEKTGLIQIAIKAKVVSGKSTLKVTFGGKSKDISLSNTEFEIIEIGSFHVEKIGYQFLELQGIQKSSTEFAQISELLIGGEVTSGAVYYVKDDFYWGRRGPSVHLNYEVPTEAGNLRWFYNEMTIPEGNDVLGSYFMANGFGEGYFGIQVNSETERRILFSVWSPFKTDDPNAIPEDHKIKLLKKGKDVYSGEFGNEGSGGQSYRKYFWRAGTTYRFLLKGEPSENNSTDYTAYFFAPEIGKWELIASFRRPQTQTYLKRPHSFLENFIPEMGCITRQVRYTNQWVCNSEGKWTELNRAKFTADATARKESRLDYSGGDDGSFFFLKNCGFFSDKVTFDTWFSRSGSGKTPEINFSLLP
ncbi:MAG: DUF3472 domain-containing protein [Prolixibacteraceae bacterium]|nr:DUF3472 domain-containing protein [Prolixibacteraceae bacterium]